MRKYTFCLAVSLLLFVATGMTQAVSFSYAPRYPSPGDKVTITYNPAGTVLASEENIEAVGYVFNNELGTKAIDLPLKKTGDTYSCTLPMDKNSVAVALYFYKDEKKDNNGKEGYIIQLYDDRQQTVPGANTIASQLYTNSYLNFVMGLEQLPDRALAYAEKDYKDYPAYRSKSASQYFTTLLSKKKEEAKPIIEKGLEEMVASGKLDEVQYMNIANWYTRLKMKDKAEAVKELMKEKYPDGKWVKNEKVQAITSENDLEKRKELIEAFVKEFPPENENDENTISYFHSLLASAYAKEEKWDAFKAEIAKMTPQSQASQYNNIAWGMAEKDENMSFAKEISYKATTWAKNEIDNPTTTKSDMRTESQWKEDRKSLYSMYADTYAYILYKLKDYKTGFTYAKDAVDIRKRKDAEYNDRYALLLEKTAPPKQVKKELEEMMYDGHGGKETKEVLKRAYVSVNKSDKGLDVYLADIEKANLERIREEVRKKMLHEDNDAPLFRLVNLEGKEVDLTALKGKVVILDFWATWCGPCKASFPAMQRAVEKYKNNPNVVFLFIDTWERGDNREKLVEEFIAQNKYTFNVLYDTPKKESPNDFVVVEEYKVQGIPTKFVVDGSGQIRFKSIGWSGNEEAFIQELSTMIDMAGQEGSSGESRKKGF